tara:strand:- start:4709 stop:5575 length:867 start_codon:yes stop_codon:yes gene_type:complete
MRFVFKIWQLCLTPILAVGTQFLTLPSTAQELAIGSHPTANFSFSVNPALYNVQSSSPKLSISMGSWLAGSSNSHLSYTQRLKSRTLHIRLDHTDISDLELRDDRPVDKPKAYFSAFGLSATIGFSSDLGNGSYGLSFSRVQMGIFNQSATGYILGVGYLYHLSRTTSIGVSVLNLGTMSKFESVKPDLPNRIMAGIGKKIQFKNYVDNINATIEWNKYSNSYQLCLGNTFRWKSLIIMAGSSFSQDTFNSSTGFGLESKGYSIRYGIRFGSQNIGYPQSISIEISLP